MPLTCCDVADRDQVFEQKTLVKAPIEKVFEFFSEAKNLEMITPPWLNFKIIDQSTPNIQAGTILTYKLKIHGIPIRWKTLIESWTPNLHFVDTQIKGPYKKWHHTHRFTSTPEGTIVEDTVLFRVHFGLFGQLLTGNWVRKDVKKIFLFREKMIESIFSPKNKPQQGPGIKA